MAFYIIGLPKLEKSMIEFNSNSLDHLSCFFFGGVLKEDIIEPLFDENQNPILFKSGERKGQIKTHKIKQDKYIKGLLDGKGKVYSLPLAKDGFYSTNEEVLNRLTKLDTPAGQVASILLECRGLKKQISTYYASTEELVYDIDGCVHPQFNHTGTETGRLSCKSPNLQNQPDSQVLEHFTSRFGKSGQIISIDLSQIEVILFAYYCRDMTLISLIKDGLDVHRYLSSRVLNKPQEEVTKDERKAIKAVTFGIIYGNGAFKLAQTLNISEEKAKLYIDTFYQEFPGAKKWHKRILLEVSGGKNQINGRWIETPGSGVFITPTRRILKFTQYPAKFDWQDPDKLYYNPPDIKNWPVQSFAGDIYKALLQEMYLRLINLPLEQQENIKLINTIHDSIMFDVSDGYLNICIQNIIKDVLDNYQTLIYTKYKIEFDLPINYEISIGNSWDKLQKLENEVTNDSSSK